jgi:hypothetical protein
VTIGHFDFFKMKRFFPFWYGRLAGGAAAPKASVGLEGPTGLSFVTYGPVNVY